MVLYGSLHGVQSGNRHSRFPASTVAIDDSNAAHSTIAHAADITVPELEDRLAMRTDFTLLEVIGIGGILHSPPR